MKINPISNPNILKSYQAAKLSAPKIAKGASRLDEVTFSDEAISFSKAMAEAKDQIELRSPAERAHIAELTAAVRQGSYRVDSDKIAERMLSSITGEDE